MVCNVKMWSISVEVVYLLMNIWNIEPDRFRPVMDFSMAKSHIHRYILKIRTSVICTIGIGNA